MPRMTHAEWRHRDVAVEADVNLHVAETGPPDGETAVLLHGWPGGWYDWRRLAGHLGEFRIVAPDLRGFGGSSKPDVSPADGYTPGHLAADIHKLVTAESWSPVVVVGHDIGATVAQSLARSHPEAVRALVLCNPAYPGIGARRYDPDRSPEFWYQQLHQQPWAERLVGASRESVALYFGHFYRHWGGPDLRLTDDEFAEAVEAFASPDALRGCFSYYRARAKARAGEAAVNPADVRITPATHVRWGELDPLMVVDWADRLAEYFNLASYETLPGVGHFVPQEAPEACAAVLRLASR
jgi:pimeloyl-ACP methyl ester carboxylesterase